MIFTQNKETVYFAQNIMCKNTQHIVPKIQNKYLNRIYFAVKFSKKSFVLQACYLHGFTVVLFVGIRQYPITALRWLLHKNKETIYLTLNIKKKTLMNKSKLDFS